ncbi:MAG: hypothetical protein HS115_03110 [Spirochaetales bacterium]|nr:hypothetical protein [Spirochaetales bacterium]
MRIVCTIFTAGLMLFYCRLPLAHKSFHSYNPKAAPGVERITQAFTGDVLILRIATGSSPDVWRSLHVTRAIHQCTELQNVDLELYDWNFYLFGFPRLIIRADCLRSQTPATEKPALEKPAGEKPGAPAPGGGP